MFFESIFISVAIIIVGLSFADAWVKVTRIKYQYHSDMHKPKESE